MTDRLAEIKRIWGGGNSDIHWLISEVERLQSEYSRLERTVKFMEESYLAGHDNTWGECVHKAKVERLRGELDKEPTREWFEKRCQMYLERLVKQDTTIATLREALEFYANHLIYESDRDDSNRVLPPPVVDDGGRIARKDLAGTESQHRPGCNRAMMGRGSPCTCGRDTLAGTEGK